MISKNLNALSIISVKVIAKWTLHSPEQHQTFGTISTISQPLMISSQITVLRFVNTLMEIVGFQIMISASKHSTKFTDHQVDALLEIMFQNLINLTEESIQDVRNNTVITMK